MPPFENNLRQRKENIWLEESTNCIKKKKKKPLHILFRKCLEFPACSASKESACNAGDLNLIPGLGRSPGVMNGYPLQYSGLENSMSMG